MSIDLSLVLLFGINTLERLVVLFGVDRLASLVGLPMSVVDMNLVVIFDVCRPMSGSSFWCQLM